MALRRSDERHKDSHYVSIVDKIPYFIAWRVLSYILVLCSACA
jgi:hypothetical protein